MYIFGFGSIASCCAVVVCSVFNCGGPFFGTLYARKSGSRTVSYSQAYPPRFTQSCCMRDTFSYSLVSHVIVLRVCVVPNIIVMEKNDFQVDDCFMVIASNAGGRQAGGRVGLTTCVHSVWVRIIWYPKSISIRNEMCAHLNQPFWLGIIINREPERKTLEMVQSTKQPNGIGVFFGERYRFNYKTFSMYFGTSACTSMLIV